MRLITIPVGGLAENCYIYYDESTLAGAVIDPGGDANKILVKIQELNLNISAILLTHGHYDHTGAVGEVKAATGAEICACAGEDVILTDPKRSYGGWVIDADRFLEGDELYMFGNAVFRVIHTPGHTAGSCCYYDEAGKVLFSGDTLFHESVGRHDFPTGNRGQLMDSIKSKLFTLPDDVAVYPGHMEATTIGHEKGHNPFVI